MQSKQLPHYSGSQDAWLLNIEGQRQADRGNGQYLNPVLPGDHPDPNVLKDGDDYYLSYSSFDYYPGIVIWHSRDLVNWTPMGPALRTNIGSIWALDLVKHEGRYFIYIPAFRIPGVSAEKDQTAGASSPFKVYVIHSEDMRGPWSEPIDMGIEGNIDPGHAVGEDGERYLFLSGGHRVRITADGLRRAGPIEQVYAGWQYPEEWIVEGFALEGPKVMRHGDWFYMFSGEGGTAGPPTSHMVVVARARSINGPWENCPHNPIVHTGSRNELWMSRGHATAVEGPKGDWWLLYHGYENGFRTLGRQSLLEPFEWTADGWPLARGEDASEPMSKPIPVTTVNAHGQPLSDDFLQNRLGTYLAFYQPQTRYLERARFTERGMQLAGQGDGPADSSPLAMIIGDHSYEVTVEFELRGSVLGGLLLFYNNDLFCGIGCDGKRLRNFKLGKELSFGPSPAIAQSHLFMRVQNVENVATFFWSEDGTHWQKANSYEVSGYNHNVGDGFLSLRPAIFASGKGDVLFKRMKYSVLQS
jgi:xylan 1,4-beta-xylosidase